MIRHDELKYILGTPQGRAVLWDILSEAGLYHTPFSVDDQRITDFNCGKHNIALTLWAECLAADPRLAAKMIEEQGNERSSSPDDTGTEGSEPDNIVFPPIERA